jgi:1-aminocyclopropane-1-carboxylate deaminase/D-cysteine desulfhydrase-like pyridoxal-dependent ACC family enzyme
MKETSELLEIETELPALDLLDMCGPGYSIPSKEGVEAMSLMMSLEGIVLDTCYTGKAFAGLIQRAKEGYYQPTDNVLFIHTGGAAGLFAQNWE